MRPEEGFVLAPQHWADYTRLKEWTRAIQGRALILALNLKMIRLIVNRIFATILVRIGVSFVAFVALHFSPGDVIERYWV